MTGARQPPVDATVTGRDHRQVTIRANVSAHSELSTGVVTRLGQTAEAHLDEMWDLPRRPRDRSGPAPALQGRAGQAVSEGDDKAAAPTDGLAADLA